jgi:hypothetical protein
MVSDVGPTTPCQQIPELVQLCAVMRGYALKCPQMHLWPGLLELTGFTRLESIYSHWPI